MKNLSEKLIPRQSIDYWGAVKAFAILSVKKDDLTQALNLVTSLNGNSAAPAAYRFFASDFGQHLLANPNYLAPLFDRDYLLSLPQGSLGRVYAQSLIEEGLNPECLQESDTQSNSEFGQFRHSHPEYFIFGRMFNHTHDLYHTITGYGRDLIGEAALLKFTAKSMGGRGSNVLSELIALRVRALRPLWPTGKIMSFAKTMAAGAPGMAVTDVLPLLPLQLWEARRVLNIRPDPYYASISKDDIAKVMFREKALA